jgi:cell division protein FtsW (lipid II flippase)
MGVLILCTLFGTILYRLVEHARHGETNFESLVALGVALLFLVHATVHVGTNVGLLPVTGTTFPFMSYGGSHILVEYTLLGLVVGMRHYGRAVRSVDETDMLMTARTPRPSS